MGNTFCDSLDSSELKLREKFKFEYKVPKWN